ncbi:MAG: methyltransferase [Nitrospinales bacterium]
MLTFDQILEKIDQLEEAKALIAALQLRIFTVLGKKRLTIKEICRGARTHADGTEALLNALVAMGALRKTGNRFFNTSVTYKHFCETSKEYKKGMVMLRKEHREEWDKLMDTVRDGRDLSEYEGEDDPEFRRLFSYAMHERSEKISPKVVKIVARKPVGRLLDLGCGPASYSAAILRKDKRASATLLDRPAAIVVAREITQKVKNRCRFLPGNLFDTPFGENHDTVFYSNILHIYNEKENEGLFKKINRALVPGGRFVLADLFLKDNRTEPYDAAMFSLTMLLFTATGRTYTFRETEALLRRTGFHRFKRFHLGQGNAIIEAVKKND